MELEGRRGSYIAQRTSVAVSPILAHFEDKTPGVKLNMIIELLQTLSPSELQSSVSGVTTELCNYLQARDSTHDMLESMGGQIIRRSRTSDILTHINRACG